MTSRMPPPVLESMQPGGWGMFGRRITSAQLSVMVAVVLLAAGLPALVLSLRTPRVPPGGGRSWPPTLTVTLTPTLVLEPPSTPLRPIQQTAVPIALTPGTLAPDAFAGAFIEMAYNLDPARSVVTIIVPARPGSNLHARVTGWGSKDYACSSKSPDSTRLYCIGPRLPVGVPLVLTLYRTFSDGSVSAVFRASFLIPLLPTATGANRPGAPAVGPTVTPSSTPTSTAVPSWTASATPSPTATCTLTPSPTVTPMPPTEIDTPTSIDADTPTPDTPSP